MLDWFMWPVTDGNVVIWVQHCEAEEGHQVNLSRFLWETLVFAGTDSEDAIAVVDSVWQEGEWVSVSSK